MDIKADVTSIKNLKGYFFVVPDYQREYVWKAEENVNQFLQDIYDEFDSGSSNQTNYFIGNTILVENKDGSYDVVDGQQRLTTIIIALCAIRKVLDDLHIIDEELNEQKKQLEKVVTELLYEYDFNKNKSIPRLILQYTESKDFLNRLIRDEEYCDENTPSIIKMRNAFSKIFEFLTEELKAKDDKLLIHFIKYFLHNVQMVIIKPDNLGSALKIFETINERGIGLNALDLLKNLLFINADQSVFEEIKQTWQQMITRINESGEGDKPLRFLRYFLISRYSNGKIIREDEIYKWIISDEAQKVIKYKSNPIRFAKELRIAAGRYTAFVNATKAKDADNDYPNITGIGYLTKKTSRQHLVLLMALKDNVDRKIVNLLAKNIESLVFYYSANRTLTKYYEEKFAKWASKIRLIDKIEELREFLNDDFKKEFEEEQRKFNSQFANKSQSDFNPQYRIKYVLGKIEEYVRGMVNIPSANLSYYQSQQLEHILPQTGINIPIEKFPEQYDYENSVRRFGNLTLLEAPINQSINSFNDISTNQWYTLKCNEYRNSNILLTRTLSEMRIGQQTVFNKFANSTLKAFDSWDMNTVTERQEILGRLILDIWKIETDEVPPSLSIDPTHISKTLESTTSGYSIDKYYKIEKKGINAKGFKSSEAGKFTILEGSTIAIDTVPSIPDNVLEIRRYCEYNGIISNGIFTQNFEFNSISLAAKVVLGSNVSGNVEWKEDVQPLV